MVLPSSSSSARVVIGRRLALVSAVFIVVVATVMAMHVYLLKTADPLETPALDTLIEQLERDGGNDALREQVRELDWLARRAFFVRQGQLERGARLLAAGAIVFMLALQLMLSGQAPAPDPRGCPGLDHPWAAAARARRLIVGAGLLILAAVWGVHILAHRAARGPVMPATADRPAAGSEADGVVSVPPADRDPAAIDPAAAHDGWPSFRGPHGLGVAADADPPVAWDGASGAGILWKTPIARPGFSSPIVWGNRVFLTGADSRRREVYGFDADTGALLWTADTADVPGVPDPLPAVTADTGYAAPTPVTDGRRVIALFGTGVILGLDIEGRRLWARQLGVPANHYGHSSSLLLWRDLVLVQYDHAGGSTVMGLDIETGRERWSAARPVATSWASPILAPGEDRARLILAADPLVAAYDPVTGTLLWQQDLLNGEIGSSPAYAAGRVLVANQYALAAAIDVATGDPLWTSTDLELPDAGSPVATADYLFMPTTYGVFTCLEAATGIPVWEHEFEDGGYGSPILAGNRIYWVTADGTTRIFKAADQFELIAEPRLGEASVCTPAPVGRRLYLRGERHLFCIGAE